MEQPAPLAGTPAGGVVLHGIDAGRCHKVAFFRSASIQAMTPNFGSRTGNILTK